MNTLRVPRLPGLRGLWLRAYRLGAYNGARFGYAAGTNTPSASSPAAVETGRTVAIQLHKYAKDGTTP